MNCSMTFKFKTKTEKTKGLSLKGWTHLKTQTNLEIQWTKKDRPDFIGDIAADVRILDLGASPLEPVVVLVEGCKSLGLIINRSVNAFAKAGMKVEELEWNAEAGLVEFIIPGGNGAEAAPLAELIARMIIRATTKFSSTRHPLSTYDLKQTTSLIHDADSGMEGVQDVIDWMLARELAVAEEEKAALATKRAKEKAKKAKVEEVKEEIKDKPNPN